jgi:hypothetical protein
MKYVVLVTLLLSAGIARAVNPLVTDDATPVDFRQLQICTGWQFSRADAVDLDGYYLNPTIGITPRSELGLSFGYQWRDGPESANGITDLSAETKWLVWKTQNDPFRVSMRFDLKLPTASPALGLGTGTPDADVLLIATCSHTNTSLDWDIGYTKIDATHAVFSADRWFLGQTIRQQLNDTWTLMGEAYATIPNSSAGAPMNLNFDGGVQYSVKQNILLSLLVGSAAGRDSPELTANFCLTWYFGPFGGR